MQDIWRDKTKHVMHEEIGGTRRLIANKNTSLGIQVRYDWTLLAPT